MRTGPLFRNLLHSQAPMALSSALFVYTCARFLGRKLPWPLYLAAFFGTWAIYLWDAGLGTSPEDRINHPERAGFFLRHRWLPHLLAPVSLGIAGLLVLSIPWRLSELALLLTLGAIGTSYVFAFIPFAGKRHRLKEIHSVKAHYICISWALGGLGLPLVIGTPTGEPLAAPFPILCAVIYLLLYIDTVALDMRDAPGDRTRGIETAAVILGPRCHGFLLGLATVTFMLWVFGATAFGDQRWLIAGGAMVTASLIGVGMLSRWKDGEFAYELAVGSWRFLGAILLLL